MCPCICLAALSLSVPVCCCFLLFILLHFYSLATWTLHVVWFRVSRSATCSFGEMLLRYSLIHEMQEFGKSAIFIPTEPLAHHAQARSLCVDAREVGWDLRADALSTVLLDRKFPRETARLTEDISFIPKGFMLVEPGSNAVIAALERRKLSLPVCLGSHMAREKERGRKRKSCRLEFTFFEKKPPKKDQSWTNKD